MPSTNIYFCRIDCKRSERGFLRCFGCFIQDSLEIKRGGAVRIINRGMTESVLKLESYYVILLLEEKKREIIEKLKRVEITARMSDKKKHEIADLIAVLNDIDFSREILLTNK